MPDASSTPPPPTPPTPTPPRHDAYGAFRERPFRRFMLSAVWVQMGTGAQSTAIGWEVYIRTGSAKALAFTGLLQAVPMLLFTLPAGWLADNTDRRRLMLIGMLGTSMTSLALAVFSHLQGSLAVMYLLLFLDSTALRLTGPARVALVPQLVPAHKLENAMKWRSSLGQIAGVLGPVAGGFIIAWWLPGAYLFSALTTFGFMAILLTIEVPPTVRQAGGRMLAQVWEGIQFVWQRKVILGTVSLDLFAVLLGGATYLLPMFVRDVINLEGTGVSEEQALGWLRAAPAAGAMTMALLLTHMPPFRKAGRTMLWSVAAFGAATIVFGFSQNLWLSLAMLFLTGTFDNISVVVRHTLVQLLTPNHMRGRVSAVNSIFIGSSNEVGGFRAGMVASVIGPMASVVAGGLCTLLVVATWASLFPRLRQFGSMSDAVEAESAAGAANAATVAVTATAKTAAAPPMAGAMELPPDN